MSSPVQNTRARRSSVVELRLNFGCSASVAQVADGLAIDLSLPVLSGPARRTFALGAGAGKQANGFATWLDKAGRQWGAGVMRWRGEPLEALSHQMYQELFALTTGRHLHRLWNFVPQINESTHGLENYRRFSLGRSQAFDEAFGDEAKPHMPAGSAVGIEERALVVLFLAGPEDAKHFENPLQVPAYEYPSDYGPRPPSFARASQVSRGRMMHHFISGTSSVRGHQSVANDDLQGQISTTLEMLSTLGKTIGIGPELAAKRAQSRQFLVYLRHPRDLAEAEARLRAELLTPEDVVTYVQADICRRELLIEIEGSLLIAQ